MSNEGTEEFQWKRKRMRKGEEEEFFCESGNQNQEKREIEERKHGQQRAECIGDSENEPSVTGMNDIVLERSDEDEELSREEERLVQAKWDAWVEEHGETILTPEEALAVLAEYEKDIRRPAEVWRYNAIIRAYSRGTPSQPWKGEEVVEQMVARGMEADCWSYFWVIDGYSRVEGCSGGEEGRRVMNLMKERRMKPTVFCYNALTVGYVRRDERRGGADVEGATEAYEEMRREGIAPDLITFHILLHGLSKRRGRGDVEIGIGLYREMKEVGITPDVLCFNMMMTTCIGGGDVESAKRMYGEMRRWGLEPDVVVFNNDYSLQSCFGRIRL